MRAALTQCLQVLLSHLSLRLESNSDSKKQEQATTSDHR